MSSRSRGTVQAAFSLVGELSLTAGILTLLFVVWQLYWTDLTSGSAQAASVDRLTTSWAAAPAAAPTETSSPTETAPAGGPQVSATTAAGGTINLTGPAGDAFAIIYVPRFGRNYAVPIVEGTATDDLKEGVGHYPKSALPGETGNVALAGHRVTYGKPFNLIAELQVGDAVVIATRTQWFTYRVVWHEIVAPTAVSVIAAVPDQPGARPTQAWLTMTACHPEFSAKQRYVVHALLQSVQDRSAGPPSSMTGP